MLAAREAGYGRSRGGRERTVDARTNYEEGVTNTVHEPRRPAGLARRVLRRMRGAPSPSVLYVGLFVARDPRELS